MMLFAFVCSIFGNVGKYLHSRLLCGQSADSFQEITKNFKILKPNRKMMQMGRSMLEMIGVLALIGMLTILSIGVLRLLMNKRQASLIIHDASIAHMDSTDMPCDQEYHIVNFDKESDAIFESYCDAKQHRYVRASEITDGVCVQIKAQEQEGKFVLYAQDEYSKPTCQDGNNVILFAFDGTPAPALDCETYNDCPAGEKWVCSATDGFCEECAKGYVANLGYDGCVPVTCDSLVETLCSADDGEKWCCLKTLLCGQTKDECLEACPNATDTFCTNDEGAWCCEQGFSCGRTMGECSDGKCWATYKQEEYEADLCELSYTQSPTGSLCQITFSDDASTLTVEQYDTCGAGSYCYISYKDDARSVAVSNNSTGTLYGRCIPMKEVVALYGYTMTETIPCPRTHYCYVAWKNEERTQSIENSSTGSLYGKCIPLKEVGTLYDYRYTEQKTCGQNEYCRLQWASDESCDNPVGNASKIIYGVCIPLSESEYTCPYQQ